MDKHELWEQLSSNTKSISEVTLPEQTVDNIIKSVYTHVEYIVGQAVVYPEENIINWDIKLDNMLTSRLWGIPFMAFLLMLLFWLTISGANYPSQWLLHIFNYLELQGIAFFVSINTPIWLTGFLVEGIFKTVSWVIAVMLPPVLIFFPLFSLLEEAGYLPRIAFNTDFCFKRVGAHGKQCLTMWLEKKRMHFFY